jgi:hypothetical protein
MGFFRDVEQVVLTEVAPPTLDERLAAQDAVAAAAIGLFVQAVEDLERSAESLERIAEESQIRAELHEARAIEAENAADLNRVRAAKIRSLLN